MSFFLWFFLTFFQFLGGLFLSGILLFSGSLYLMGMTQNRKFGMITPIGGFGYIFGWIALALATKRKGF